ncbi:LacI family DNA-binding transcriptional regulator [Clostridium sediminicola]|uniref:LacI family DNA-binding transcriptional regulator n=1 Tax=Clostridium sediminicola TaxID=3114879 RepID=UPI0031F1C9C8
MRVTIKDIAKHTGFSATTVSLVLNGKGKRISDKTKKVIFKAVKELDYRPNQLAVGLVKKRTKTIGLVISDIRNVFFSNLAKGVEDECRKNGWNLILCNTNDLHERDMEYIKVLADKGVDGILYAMSADSNFENASESLSLMDSIKIPYIMIDRTVKEKSCNFVATDHFKGGYLATKHLIELGHKRIACVTGPLYLNDSEYRLEGYKKALNEEGISYDSSIIYEGDYTFDSGKEAIDVLSEKCISAVFAFNDMSAYGVYTQLKKYNYSIPEDISLVGYDDIFFSELLDVPLTTVKQPIYKVGTIAADLIINKKKCDENNLKEIMLTPELIVRESTGISY